MMKRNVKNMALNSTAFHLAVAAFVLAGCSKEQKPDCFSLSDTTIKFEAPLVGLSSKSVIETAEYPSTAPNFRVFATYNETAPSSPRTLWEGTDYFQGAAEMEYKQAEADSGESAFPTLTDTWSFKKGDPVYFWPKQGFLSFLAYSPAELPEGCSVEVSSEAEGNGLLFTGFTAATEPENMTDLLYSNLTADQWRDVNSVTDGGVQIVFNHSLSCIKFNMQTPFDYSGNVIIKLKELKLVGLKNEGDFYQNLEGEPEWTVTGESRVDYTVFSDAGGQVITDGSFTDFKPLVVLPQELTSDCKFLVTYTIQHTGGEVFTQTLEVPLSPSDASGEGVCDFDPGTRYTFNMYLSLSQIYFTPVVDIWSDENLAY